MKPNFPLFAALTASAIIAATLGLTGCKHAPTADQVTSTTTTVESQIDKGIAALPATFKADVASVVAKAASPENLNTVANGIESLAKAGANLPSPASLNNGVLPWVEQLPKVGPVLTGVVDAYTVAYPLLQPSAQTLTYIAEFIRSLEPTRVAVASPVALAQWRTSIQMAYVVQPRRED